MLGALLAVLLVGCGGGGDSANDAVARQSASPTVIELIEVPGLVGRTVRQAKNVLHSFKIDLDLVVEYRPDAGGEPCVIIEQMPVYGQEVTSGSPVVVWIPGTACATLTSTPPVLPVPRYRIEVRPSMTRPPTTTTTRVTRGAWVTEVKTSLMDDLDTIIVRLAADNTITSWLGLESRPELVFNCKDRKLVGFVNIGTSLESDLSWNTSVRLRFDKHEPTRVTTSVSTDSNSVFLPDPGAIINQLLDAEEFLIEVAPLNTNKQVAIFLPAGLGFHRPKLMKTCAKALS